MKKIIFVLLLAFFVISECWAEVRSANKSYNDSTIIIEEPLITQLGQAIKQGKLDEVKQLLTDNQIDLTLLTEDVQFRLLDIATYNGHLNLVKFFLEQGININVSEKSGRIALHYAVWHSKTDIAYYLIDHGADVNAIYSANGGLSPLCCAVENGDMDLVKYLIKHGADARYENESSGGSPIRSAAYGGHMEVFKYLEEQLPANFDWQPSLSHAIIGGNLKLVKYVVESKKVRVNEKTQYLGYPIHIAAGGITHQANRVEIMKYLLSKGARLKDINNGDIFPWALDKCNEETIVFLLENGVKYVPEKRGNYGDWPVLPYALGRGQFKLAQYLLKTEKDFDFKDESLVVFFADGRHNSAAIMEFLIYNGINKEDYPKAFLRSAESGDLESVKLFFETGVDINVTDTNGNNAIALTQSENVANYLMEKGINTSDETFRENVVFDFGVLKAVEKAGIELNAPAIKINKALIDAARIGDEWVVEYLLKKGADPNDKTMETTPLIENAMQGYEHCLYGDVLISADVIKLLLKAGADVNTTDKEGRTALHYASGDQKCKVFVMTPGYPKPHPTQQHDSIMIALIEGGADMNIQDNDGNTPLILAAIHNNSAGMKILLRYGAKSDLKNKKGRTFDNYQSNIEQLKIEKTGCR